MSPMVFLRQDPVLSPIGLFAYEMEICGTRSLPNPVLLAQQCSLSRLPHCANLASMFPEHSIIEELHGGRHAFWSHVTVLLGLQC